MPILVVLAIIATAAILGFGIAQMVRSGKSSGADEIARARRSNKLMQYRIYLQAIAIGLFLLMLAMRG